jgi:hypothetical protein
MRTEIADVTDRLLEHVESEDYAGYDPYDALNSPAIKLVSSRSKWLRLAFTQLLRRSPVNFRPLLGVKRAHNPKGIGLFLWGYAKLYKLNPEEAHLTKIHYLLDLLDQLKSPGYSGNCWGYNFDWQSRTFYRPKGAPTIVNTAFIGHALLDCYEITGLQRSLDMALSIKDFILNDLHRTKQGDTFCFSYTPMDTGVVHNANMLGASILIRLFKYCGDSACRDDALSSLAYSMQYQHEDGSWFYADTECQKWIDSFHTGFNLQALRYCLDEGLAGQYLLGYEKGVEYYANNFFLADGTPKYFHNRVYPIDIHAPAEAITFFSGMGETYGELTDNILSWMLRHMLSRDGYFYFRKTRYFTNKISYMRWTQAWVFLALTEYLLGKSLGNTQKADI